MRQRTSRRSRRNRRNRASCHFRSSYISAIEKLEDRLLLVANPFVNPVPSGAADLYPFVGEFVAPAGNNDVELSSGSLVAPGLVLTAAHVADDSDLTFNIGGQQYPATERFIAKGWFDTSGQKPSDSDLALVEIGPSAVTGALPTVQPAPIAASPATFQAPPFWETQANGMSSYPSLGYLGTYIDSILVGYGTDATGQNAGIKRAGITQLQLDEDPTTDDPNQLFNYYLEGVAPDANGNVAQLGIPANELSAQSHGDSGGPYLQIGPNGQYAITAVVSSGQAADNMPIQVGDMTSAVNATVFNNTSSDWYEFGPDVALTPSPNPAAEALLTLPNFGLPSGWLVNGTLPSVAVTGATSSNLPQVIDLRPGTQQQPNIVEISEVSGNFVVTVNGTTTDYPAQGPETIVDLGGTENIVTLGNVPSDPLAIEGDGAANGLVGPSDPNIFSTWTVTGTGSGTVDGVSFDGINTLKGGSGGNVFNVEATPGKMSIIGGSANDTIEGPSAANVWDISGLNSGTLNGTIAFSDISNLIGGNGTNEFAFGPNGMISGDVNGGAGFDTLDYSETAGPVKVDLANNTASDIDGSISNFTNFIGSASTADTLVGPDATWAVAGTNSGTVNGLTFWSFENLTGGAGPNQFIFLPGGSLSGNLQGGAGTNTLDYSEYGASVTVNLGNDTVPGSIGGTFANIQSFVGGAAPNTLIGPNGPTEWTINAANGGTVSGLSFTNFENLDGGTTSDNNFAIMTGGSLSGQIVGGGGFNTLDYGDYTGNVVVDLLLGDATAIAGGVSSIQTVFGGFGNSLIVGDAGALQLEGGTGHNILIADTGAASLIGGSGDNILIGDPTIYDSNLTALSAIFAEWSRTNITFAQRLADLTSYSRTSLNGNDLLTPFTVFASGASDALLDGAGLNWNILTVGQDSVTIAEGQSLTMTPTAVPPTSGTLSYAWNINGNGNYNQASGPDPTLTWSQLNSLGINDGPESFSMRLRITNGRSTVTSNPSTLYVTPVSPTATLNNNGPVAQGSAATVSFSNQFDPSPVETAAGFLYSYDFWDNGTFEVVNSKSAVATVPASDLLTVGPHVVHARITEAKGGKFTDYYTTINVVASVPKVTVGTPIPTSVPGEPVPLVIRVSDTSTTAQAASFNFQVSFGDGDTTTFAGTTPVLVTHTYTQTGTYVVQVTATDEYGNVSVVATQTIKVVPVAVEADPFHPGETALFVGGTSGNDTVSFAASGRNIAVTLNSVSEGTFSANGSLIVFGQGGTDVVHEGAGLRNPAYLLESLTTDNIETDLDNEALQWAGLKSALEILNV